MKRKQKEKDSQNIVLIKTKHKIKSIEKIRLKNRIKTKNQEVNSASH